MIRKIVSLLLSAVVRSTAPNHIGASESGFAVTFAASQR